LHYGPKPEQNLSADTSLIVEKPGPEVNAGSRWGIRLVNAAPWSNPGRSGAATVQLWTSTVIWAGRLCGNCAGELPGVVSTETCNAFWGFTGEEKKGKGKEVATSIEKYRLE